ncbi:Aste57867_3072 [Aphanomyces stellatus]|uniref:Aste57867_3072 protein n=1 Tax=Aphanomyces stellatus TaxID=120398 RepID=A0A485K9Z3_9STRA|nr:hypothetical protein As57867_003063 [Aphanomyces stellatus]VFT80252.1 Aste57867_3072 [Aphanomyces stellatus]
MVRIVIATIGSRGDLQPYCILGQALAARGHDVAIATEKRLESLVTNEFKLPFRCIVGDCCRMLFDPVMQAKLRTCSFFETLQIIGDFNKDIDPREIMASYVAALDGADIVVSSYLSFAETYCVAEAKQLRWVPVFLGNFQFRTSEYPSWVIDGLTFGLRWLNRLSYSLLVRMMWQKQRAGINTSRQELLALPSITSPEGIMGRLQEDDIIIIHIAASTLFAGPKHKLPTDIDPTKVNYTGFLFPLNNPVGSSSLQTFIQEAKYDAVPVIYLGFGSMPTLEPLLLVQLIVQVCQTAKCRCVFVSGWSSTSSPECQELLTTHSDLICNESSVSHPWLFPQMSCILHHAGLGTTAAALQSGIPQIPCPIMVDQFYNAKKMVQLGVALTTIGSKQLTAVNVSKAVKAVLHNEKHVRMRAQEMGKYVTDESAGNLDRLCDQLLAAKAVFA